MIYFKTISTKLGPITIAELNGAIIMLDFGGGDNIDGIARDTKLLCDAARQLTEYMAGKRKTFKLKLAPAGTDFQNQVWQALQKIPFGKTIAYAEIARILGRPRAFRPVGNAVGRNPIPIIIPCHRVIATDGGIGGFSSGLPLKRRLLKLEGLRHI